MKRKQKQFLGFTAILFAVILTLAGCDIDKDDLTYYYEIGEVSPKALELITSSPFATAQQLLAYCHQNPAQNDKYRASGSGYTRSQLEDDLNQIKATGFSTSQFLGILDSGGAAFQAFTTIYDDYLYLYVKEE
jgi:hypothetical protein